MAWFTSSSLSVRHAIDGMWARLVGAPLSKGKSLCYPNEQSRESDRREAGSCDLMLCMMGSHG